MEHKTQWHLDARWFNASDRAQSVFAEHREALGEQAYARALTMVDEGFTEGELDAWLGRDDHDVHYRGWWSFQKTEPKRRFCPYCGGADVTEVGEDADPEAQVVDKQSGQSLDEYQCLSCEGVSFWL